LKVFVGFTDNDRIERTLMKWDALKLLKSFYEKSYIYLFFKGVSFCAMLSGITVDELVITDF